MPPHTLAYRDLVRPGERFHFATSSLGPAWSEPHDHDFVEVFWVLEGRGHERVTTRERERNQSRDHLLAPGHLAAVRPEDRHAFRAESRSARLRFRNLAFPRADLERLAKQYPAWQNPFAPREPALRRFHASPPDIAALEAAAGPAVQGRRDELTLDRLLLHLELLTPSAGGAADAVPAWLTRAATAENLRAGVDAFVSACRRSPEHVARTCKAALSQTPTQLVNAARLDHAARLLGETDASVLDVCFDSGFQNVGHFHACFKRRFALTPAAYRNRAVASVPGAGERSAS